VFLNFNPASTRDFAFVPDPVAAFLRRLPEGRLSKSKEFFLLTLGSSPSAPPRAV
jgi:hypothetical protein